MTERKRESPTPSELDNLIERSTREEARKKQVLAEWNNILKEKPTTRELRHISFVLLESPQLIPGPYGPYIYVILKQWLAKTKAPSRGNSGKEIADLVGHFHKPGVRLTTARKSVADLLGMTVEAVKQNHLRHRKSKRDKSR